MPQISPVPAGRTAGPDTQYDRAQRQLTALDAWHSHRRTQQDAADVGHRSREQRLDLARRMEVVREQHRAIIARTDAQLRGSADVLARHRPRVLVVHRNSWYVDKLQTALAAHSLDVVAHLTNGAEAVGVALAEQPDLMLVEDTLPMLSGEDVVREVMQYCPRSLVAAQVAHDDGIITMLEAGARAAYARRVPPAEVAAGMVGLLDRSA